MLARATVRVDFRSVFRAFFVRFRCAHGGPSKKGRHAFRLRRRGRNACRTSRAWRPNRTKSSENRSGGRSRKSVRQGRSKRESRQLSGASVGRSGAPRGCPGGAREGPGTHPGRPGSALGVSRRVPGAPRSVPGAPVRRFEHPSAIRAVKTTLFERPRAFRAVKTMLFERPQGRGTRCRHDFHAFRRSLGAAAGCAADGVRVCVRASVRLFSRLFVCSFVPSCVLAFVRFPLCVLSFVFFVRFGGRWALLLAALLLACVCESVRLFVRSLVRLFVRSFLSFVRSFFPSFARSLLVAGCAAADKKNAFDGCGVTSKTLHARYRPSDRLRLWSLRTSRHTLLQRRCS